ncbi:protein BatD [Aurantibacter crassamenti]|uniref:BatD family protein n=1 Tax=Aurantibacter crassamenti TaxID=1837375 RepID=UPI00193A1C2F|nr:BatD family protein [Aurantibacter crassamenti]MBM1104959.1 protein BatD [Aurantibacter crassamenti]
MKSKNYIVLFLFTILSFALKAQDKEAITFELKVSKNKLGINERIRVDFSMNKDGDNFNPPDFQGFKVLMGPSQSISSSWINGVRSYSKTYSYTLAPIAQGTFTIKQATIVIDGNIYKSLAQKIVVGPAVDKPSDQMTAHDVADESLHLVAEVSNGSPYMNEAITVVYKLYFGQQIGISNYRPLDNPTYNNFWSQDIPIKRLNAQNGTYDGKPFRYVVLKRVVLYPQKSGKLEIEPLSLEITADVPTQKRDFFGGRIYSQANKTVSAGKRTINVKALPENGKPANFNGAVGDFDFKVTTSKTALNASESLQATVEVSGKGNLKLFKLPEPNLPSSLEVYEPEFDENVRTTIAGMQGKVANNYTIVPAYKGKYPIPSISFSYFDPTTKKYNTINSDEILIDVISGPSSGSANNNGSVSNTKQTVTAASDQFAFIKLNSNLVPIGATTFFGSNSFYLWWLLPLLLIPIAIIFRKKLDALAGDVEGNKIRMANRLAKKYLSSAKKALGNKEAFYVALEKGLHNYLKAKLKLETSEFSKEKINDLLIEKNVDEATIERFISLLKNCEMARYSPFSDVQIKQDYTNASEVMSYLDKQL